jgi:hypothetical protein
VAYPHGRVVDHEESWGIGHAILTGLESHRSPGVRFAKFTYTCTESQETLEIGLDKFSNGNL